MSEFPRYQQSLRRRNWPQKVELKQRDCVNQAKRFLLISVRFGLCSVDIWGMRLQRNRATKKREEEGDGTEEREIRA